MQWFHNRQTEDLICMETTVLDRLRFQTVLDSGFFLHQKARDPKAHNHLNHELYVIEKGVCTADVGGTPFSCTAGDLLFIPAGTDHRAGTLSPSDLLYSLRFSCQGLALPDQPTPLHSPQILTLVRQMRATLAQADADTPARFARLLCAFYAEFLLLLHPPITADEAVSVCFSPKQVKQLPGYQAAIPQEYYIDMLDEFFTHLPTETPTLTELANRLHLSISQTKRMIKDKYGISFQQKLIQSRIEYSKHLMHTTDLSLEEIAARIGYHSYNTFFEAFCAQTGESPSHYRRESGQA